MSKPQNSKPQNSLTRDVAASVSGRSLRTALRERRHARAAYRSLEADLASYTTDADVNDLLALLADHGGAEAEQMRGILTANLAHRSGPAAA